eukprot:227587-Rhodomonas_salina.1
MIPFASSAFLAPCRTLLLPLLLILWPPAETISASHLPTSYSPNQSSPLSFLTLSVRSVSQSVATTRHQKRRFGSLAAAKDTDN